MECCWHRWHRWHLCSARNWPYMFGTWRRPTSVGRVAVPPSGRCEARLGVFSFSVAEGAIRSVLFYPFHSISIISDWVIPWSIWKPFIFSDSTLIYGFIHQHSIAEQEGISWYWELFPETRLRSLRFKPAEWPQSSVVGGRYDTTLDRTHGRQSKMHWNLAAQGHDTV